MTTRPPIDATNAPVLALETSATALPECVRENFGTWVTRQAADLAIPVSRIAEAAGVDRTTIYRWKKGNHAPYWDSAEKVRAVVQGYWDRIGGRRSA